MRLDRDTVKLVDHPETFMDWYYTENGQRIGPLPQEKFAELASSGVITAESLVWHEGMTEWRPYREARSAAAVPPIPGAPTRVCSSCGRAFPPADLAMFGEAAICAECKAAWVQRMRQGMIPGTTQVQHRFAGFWIRFGALFLDGLIFGVLQMVIAGSTFAAYFRTVFAAAQRGEQLPPEQVAAFAGSMVTVWGIIVLLQVAYFLFFTIRYGATLGKMACGLRIVDEGGGKISAGQAAGRYFGSWLSGIILYIGFLMAAWDSEKRALHDRLAGTRVIYAR